MRKELITSRIKPELLKELERFHGSRETVNANFHFDRVYMSFFGLLDPKQKKRYIRRFEQPDVTITRLRARIWRVTESTGIPEEDVLQAIAEEKIPEDNSDLRRLKIVKRNFLKHSSFEKFRNFEPGKRTLHHIVPKGRGGTKRVSNYIEDEVHSQLHTIFGLMLRDEKARLIDWYERPAEVIIEDPRIPYRFHPAERLLLKNVRSGVMRSEFSNRLTLENEGRASYSYLTLIAV